MAKIKGKDRNPFPHNTDLSYCLFDEKNTRSLYDEIKDSWKWGNFQGLREKYLCMGIPGWTAVHKGVPGALWSGADSGTGYAYPVMG